VGRPRQAGRSHRPPAPRGGGRHAVAVCGAQEAAAADAGEESLCVQYAGPVESVPGGKLLCFVYWYEWTGWVGGGWGGDGGLACFFLAPLIDQMIDQPNRQTIHPRAWHRWACQWSPQGRWRGCGRTSACGSSTIGAGPWDVTHTIDRLTQSQKQRRTTPLIHLYFIHVPIHPPGWSTNPTGRGSAPSSPATSPATWGCPSLRPSPCRRRTGNLYHHQRALQWHQRIRHHQQTQQQRQ
jgi:hypothetical protein